MFISISNITLRANFAMCRVVWAVYLVYLSYLTLFSLYSYYKNKIFINPHSLKCFFSDEKHLKAQYFILWAEFAMGRVCNGPRVLWFEFVMGRDVPEPLNLVRSILDKFSGSGTFRP